MNFGRAALALVALTLLPRAFAAPAEVPARVVGYFNGDDSGKRLDFGLLTHVNYYFLFTMRDGSLDTSSLSLARLQETASAAHQAQARISIAVQCYDSAEFHDIATSPTALANFCDGMMRFCGQYELDGIDLDWEGFDGVPAHAPNPADFAVLIDALRARMAPGALLTAALSPIEQEISASSTTKLDWITIMAYDMKLPNHADYDDAVDAVNEWADFGVPKDKILMGVPFYAHNQDLDWATNQTEGYGNIVNVTHPGLNLDVIFDPSTSNTWYYNGADTIKKKARYVRNHEFGGIMIWAINLDHFDELGNYDHWSLLPVVSGAFGPAKSGARAWALYR